MASNIEKFDEMNDYEDPDVISAQLNGTYKGENIRGLTAESSPRFIKPIGNNLIKCLEQECRDLESIDTSLMSLFIKDNVDQSFFDLAVRLSEDLKYRFKDVCEYLQRTVLFYNNRTVDGYSPVRWELKGELPEWLGEIYPMYDEVYRGWDEINAVKAVMNEELRPFRNQLVSINKEMNKELNKIYKVRDPLVKQIRNKYQPEFDAIVKKASDKTASAKLEYESVQNEISNKAKKRKAEATMRCNSSIYDIRDELAYARQNKNFEYVESAKDRIAKLKKDHSVEISIIDSDTSKANKQARTAFEDKKKEIDKEKEESEKNIRAKMNDEIDKVEKVYRPLIDAIHKKYDPSQKALNETMDNIRSKYKPSIQSIENRVKYFQSEAKDIIKQHMQYDEKGNKTDEEIDTDVA